MFKDFHCEDCPPRLQEIRGCEKDTDKPIYDLMGYGEIKRCPLKLVTKETMRIMGIYQQCRSWNEGGPQSNGLLPYRGAVMDQPHRIMEAFEALDNTVKKALAMIRDINNG